MSVAASCCYRAVQQLWVSQSARREINGSAAALHGCTPPALHAKGKEAEGSAPDVQSPCRGHNAGARYWNAMDISNLAAWTIERRT
ncbi:hypothetical protein OPT61_g8553 [Boeremia exigua]|uniref:Uncharacterized protein n=1 Tax=Boeremia exigua TaxID=749465 RepID=A0ACC2HYC9_9PLEO|nr:hypothetical protein OPT61_g8553 [Boeremia exigua]